MKRLLKQTLLEFKFQGSNYMILKHIYVRLTILAYMMQIYVFYD